MLCVRWAVAVVVLVGLSAGLARGASPVDASIERAEKLLETAQQKKLTSALADEAAALLDHEDPFVRALAEWAIATKVERENAGQKIVWPQADPPAWYRKWSAIGPDAFLELDYCRQGIVWKLHRSRESLVGSAQKILARARGVAGEIERDGDAASKAFAKRQLAELEAACTQLADRAAKSPSDLAGLRRLWLAARRAARPIVLRRPSIDFEQLVFVTQHAAHSHRNITGSQYPWIHKPGGDICVKQRFDPSDPVRGVLAGKLGPGHVHGIDLAWDADRVAFGFASQTRWPPKWDAVEGNHSFELRRDQTPTHLFEVRLDGEGLVQLTDDPVWNDFEPAYCPNGDVVFASDRSARSSECGRFSADHTVINLYRLWRDGGAIRRLNDNKDIDRYPHTLDNGLIAYTRWEYQERHFLELHSIWTMRPDGTMALPLFKQHLGVPYGLRDTRSVPGGDLLVSIATGHHTFAYGPVVIVDPRQGINAAEAIRTVTPYAAPQEGPNLPRRVAEGGVPDQGGLYHAPFAVSDRCFLAAYSYGRPASDTVGGNNEAGFAIYLIDVYGNKELIHRDLLLSCAFPMPLRKRPRPPMVPEAVDASEKLAACYVADVYEGLDGVPRGSVKSLRIMQRVGWPLDPETGAKRWIPGNAWENQFGYWSWAPARVIGTVPVEKDGSAHFLVPADEAVYFQILDEREMELRRMRSNVTLQPGEVRGCVGCHESREKTPAAARYDVIAMRRPADRPAPPPWGTRLLGYEWLVQPVLDRHCVRCHGAKEPDGNIDLSATVAADGFVQSFRTLFGLAPGAAAKSKPGPALVSISNRFSNASISKPMQFGSHKSRLIRTLLDDDLHKKEVKLAPDEWTALVTWVDANSPYHDKFYDKRPADGGSPRRDVALDFSGK